MITVVFACGHTQRLGDEFDQAPRCGDCGERRVSRTKARAPKFTGAVMGPHATTQALDAIPLNCAPGGALPLKAKES